MFFLSVTSSAWTRTRTFVPAAGKMSCEEVASDVSGSADWDDDVDDDDEDVDDDENGGDEEDVEIVVLETGAWLRLNGRLGKKMRNDAVFGCSSEGECKKCK